jgi:uncharacterized Zn finger protein
MGHVQIMVHVLTMGRVHKDRTKTDRMDHVQITVQDHKGQTDHVLIMDNDHKDQTDLVLIMDLDQKDLVLKMETTHKEKTSK